MPVVNLDKGPNPGYLLLILMIEFFILGLTLIFKNPS